MQKDLKHILKTHKLRVTGSRLDILNFFLEHDRALSSRDLEEHFHEYDRVTLFRTLNTFTDHGVLHKIPDDSGFTSYGLCFDTCDSQEHHHNHIHFKCKVCGGIECIQKELPNVALKGYQIEEANLILNGICKDCNRG